jgi:hypothetical protein
MACRPYRHDCPSRQFLRLQCSQRSCLGRTFGDLRCNVDRLGLGIDAAKDAFACTDCLRRITLYTLSKTPHCLSWALAFGNQTFRGFCPAPMRGPSGRPARFLFLPSSFRPAIFFPALLPRREYSAHSGFDAFLRPNRSESRLSSSSPAQTSTTALRHRLNNPAKRNLDDRAGRIPGYRYLRETEIRLQAPPVFWVIRVMPWFAWGRGYISMADHCTRARRSTVRALQPASRSHDAPAPGFTGLPKRVRPFLRSGTPACIFSI